MKFAVLTIRLILGILFIYSGYTKLFPVELFEYTLANSGFIPWEITPYLARIIIGAEWLIGGWIILGISLRRITLQLAAGLLILFSIYLLYQILYLKQDGNCGCFGDTIIMSPAQAIWKNVLLLMMAYLIYILPPYFEFSNNTKQYANIALFTFVLSLALPFTLNSLFYQNDSNHSFTRTGYRPPLEILYDSIQPNPPAVELRKGKWIVAFLSLSCQHCKLAAYKLNVMKNANPAMPIYLVLNGEQEELPAFYKETNAERLPYNFLKGKENFLQLVGPVYPVIFWLNDGVVEKKTDHISTTQEAIEKWLYAK